MVTQVEVTEAEDAYRAAFYEIPIWMLDLDDEEFVKLAKRAVESGEPLPEMLESERDEEERGAAAIREYQERFGRIPWAFRGMGYSALVPIVEEALKTGKEYVPKYEKGVLY